MNRFQHEHSNDRRSAVRFSQHAAARIRQRGLPERDVELIRKAGGELVEGFVMTNRAVEQRLHELREEMSRIERLHGVALIENESLVITVYRADSARIRKLCSKH